MNPPLPYLDFFVQFGGESQADVEERISVTIGDLVAQSKADNILIVSHGAAIANFYRRWKHANIVHRKSRIQNCSLFKYDYSNEEFRLEEIIEHDFSSL